MMDLQVLFKLIDILEVEDKEHLFDYLKESLDKEDDNALDERIPNLVPGIWMSEDFTAELPDEFWGFDKGFGE